MSPCTIILHEKLIRATKGMVKAWQEWLDAKKEELTKK